MNKRQKNQQDEMQAKLNEIKTQFSRFKFKLSSRVIIITAVLFSLIIAGGIVSEQSTSKAKTPVAKTQPTSKAKTPVAKTQPTPEAEVPVVNAQDEVVSESLVLIDRVSNRYDRMNKLTARGGKAAENGDIAGFCGIVSQLNSLNDRNVTDLDELRPLAKHLPTQSKFDDVESTQETLEQSLDEVNGVAAGIC